MRDKYYIWGLALLLLGGGALADHITDNVGSGPISTFVFLFRLCPHLYELWQREMMNRISTRA